MQKPVTVENPQDAMSRVYREEFARIKGFLEAGGGVTPGLAKPGLMGNPMFPGMDAPPGFLKNSPGDIHQVGG